MLKLYYVPHTCALASHIALEEAGAQYEAIRMSFQDEDQKKPGYLAINPKGRVPALVTDKGILTETPAILAYVAQCYPEARLALVHDPFLFARAQEFNSYLCSTVHVAHAHRMRGTRWVDDPGAIREMQRCAPLRVADAFALIESRMLEGPWVMGRDFTICDAYLFTLAQWLEADGVDLSKLPRVLEHRARVAKRPAVMRALAEELAPAA
ncbi:MAG: glutathione S-transferase N-terminal domain-containing protein [Proteobacteria bacterium]|nr:glutathione S-transferase N-terminal domain-containing protein [Pseudomonadota bacterium]